MAFIVTTFWGRLDGKPTIYSELQKALGRNPTFDEIVARMRSLQAEAASP